MCAAIYNPASCEVRAVIRFLLARNNNAAEIHRQFCEVYGPNVMSDSKVRQWCRLFKEGRTNVHDEERSSRPSVIKDRKGILLIDFLERGLTINADAYCETVRKLRRAIQNKRRGMLSSGIVLCMTMRDLRPQLELLNCCNNFAGKFLTTHPTAPISRQATTTYSCI